MTDKQQKLLAKLERKALLEKQKIIKPGECLKYFKVIIDPECVSSPHGVHLLPKLEEFKLIYELRSQPLTGVITFERKLNQYLNGNNTNLAMTEKYEDQQFTIFLLQGEEAVNLIKTNQLTLRIKEIVQTFHDKQITLAIYKLREFCKLNNNTVGRRQIEYSLTELQLELNINHRLIETAADYAMMVAQLSKAIAEAPFRMQKDEGYENQSNYIENDNRDCVAIKAGDTAGFSLLWQRHLNKLPLASLETTQSIINEYPTPTSLIEAYSIALDGPNLLTDLSVRRAGGPLATLKRIGPEMSRKLFVLYTTENANEIVS